MAYRLAVYLGVLSGILLCGVNVSIAQDRFDKMISPINNPVNFEDPRTRTELRPIYIFHSLDTDFLTRGGDVQALVVQGRIEIGEGLAFILTKSGYVDFNPDKTLEDDSGFANIAFGLKNTLYKNVSAGTILTGGLRYEAPSGSTDVSQGRGDGVINPFMSVGAMFPGWNFMGGTGFRVPFDSDDSTFYDLDIHFDAPMGNFSPTLELGVVHVVDGGRRLPISDEGADLFNFGATDADGKTLVTGGVGTRYRFSEFTDFGVGYAFGLTDGSGSNFYDWRITTDFIFTIPR